MNSQIVDAIAKIRQEWEQAANGESLTDISGSVGLLLADLVSAMGLTPDEQVQALGIDLYSETQGIQVQPCLFMLAECS